MSELDPRTELASLVRALGVKLRWQQAHGVEQVPAGKYSGKAAPTQRPAQPRPEPAPRGRPRPERQGPAPAGAPPSVQRQPAPTPARKGSAEAPSAASPQAPLPDGALDGLSREEALAKVRAHLGDCKRCRLARERTKIVFGVGSPQAPVIFIGEAPGREEDRSGEPFVGAAGQLLTRMILAMGLTREEIYICNVIKCRPPHNRDPAPDEIGACEAFLRLQIDAIKPGIIVALGAHAARTLLRTDQGITKLRGRWTTYHGVPLMPSFHPAYLLRNPAGKRGAWSDLQQVMARMDELGLPRKKD